MSDLIWLSDFNDGSYGTSDSIHWLQISKSIFRHLPQTVWAGLNCVPSIPYPFRETCLGKTGPHTKIPLSVKYRMWHFMLPCLNKIPFTHAPWLGLSDPEEGISRIWGPHKNSWIRIRESESGPIRITFNSIRGSGPHPYPDLYAFCVLEDFWRVRIQGSGPGFTSHSATLKRFLATVLIKYLKVYHREQI